MYFRGVGYYKYLVFRLTYCNAIFWSRLHLSFKIPSEWMKSYYKKSFNVLYIFHLNSDICVLVLLRITTTLHTPDLHVMLSGVYSGEHDASVLCHSIRNMMTGPVSRGTNGTFILTTLL